MGTATHCGDARVNLLGGMGLTEVLARNLTKVVDETNHGAPLDGIIDGVDVHIALVEEVMEDVGCLDCRLATLLIAKNKVYPVMQVGRHVLALQGLQGEDKKSVSIWFLHDIFTCGAHHCPEETIHIGW